MALLLNPGALDDDELAPFYHGYRDLVPEGDLIAFLADQRERSLALLEALPEATQAHRYAPGKWSLAEVLGHVVDIERVFSYRAMLVARGIEGPMIGVDQDTMIAASDFDRRDWAGLVGEFGGLRQANLHLFQSLQGPVLERRGTGSGYSFSVRGLLCIVGGHAEHHLQIIRDRYLG